MTILSVTKLAQQERSIMAQLTKTLMNKRDRALSKAEKALSDYNELVDDVVADLQGMGEDIRKAFTAAERAASVAQSALDEVFNYAVKKQETFEAKDDRSEASAWSEIAHSHDVECEVGPEPPGEISEDMDGADMSCLISDFLDEA